MENRIGHIDGLRGVAILSVILYHIYSRWPALVPLPYGNRYAPVFGWGWLGVELFFIISGFVIFLTLDKCGSFAEFMFKRWLRLFPAMLICTGLIFCTAPLINRPEGLPALANALPGLSFIDDRWLAYIHGPKSLEGSFWSLYAEMKFYVFAGAVYFTLGRKWAILGLLAGFCGYWLCVVTHIEGPAYLAYLYDIPYWPWFACGALFYEWKRCGDRRLFAAAIVVGAIVSAVPMPGVGGIANMEWLPFAGFPFVLLFGAALISAPVQRLLSHPWLLFVGFISYPLYLIHDQADVGLTQAFARLVHLGPFSALLPIAPIALVMAAAWVVARHWEPRLRKALSGPRSKGITRLESSR